MLGRVMVALLAALAAGCTNLTVLQHVPFTTMSRLASFDLTKIDPTSPVLPRACPRPSFRGPKESR
jgi:hypothetical protein